MSKLNLLMRNIKILSLTTLLFLASCEKEKTICNQEGTIQAIKASLIQRVKDQSKYITDEYGIKNVENMLDSIFNTNLILSAPYLHGDISKSEDNTELCTCGTSITFTNNDEFIQHIKPTVVKLKKVEDKYSSEYLHDKHLIKFHNSNKYGFFFVMEKGPTVLNTSSIDNKVSSVLIDYLDFMQSQ